MGLTWQRWCDRFWFRYVTADGRVGTGSKVGLSRMGVVWGVASRRTLLVSRLSLSLSCLFLSFFLFSFFFFLHFWLFHLVLESSTECWVSLFFSFFFFFTFFFKVFMGSCLLSWPARIGMVEVRGP